MDKRNFSVTPDVYTDSTSAFRILQKFDSEAGIDEVAAAIYHGSASISSLKYQICYWCSPESNFRQENRFATVPCMMNPEAGNEKMPNLSGASSFPRIFDQAIWR